MSGQVWSLIVGEVDEASVRMTLSVARAAERRGRLAPGDWPDVAVAMLLEGNEDPEIAVLWSLSSRRWPVATSVLAIHWNSGTGNLRGVAQGRGHSRCPVGQFPSRCLPGLKRLTLHGKLGTLTNAESLNRLTPAHVPHLETLFLSSVPAEYATAMRAIWRTEIPNGTDVDIHAPPKPDWVAENRDNPLRDWDGREHISTARFKKAVGQYKTTRRAVLAELRAPGTADQRSRLFSLGREYGEAFNHMDRRNSFIETMEREELFDGLADIVKTAEEELGRDLAQGSLARA
ncbi:hypothetical protein ACFOSH_21905 [Amycolatopsis speibonae]|uniref:Uncharacterized protein n=1 Tax=Amycolatopsis speibonae TaxID=1450224 RepID=A0ABV7P0Z2_9PSEU